MAGWTYTYQSLRQNDDECDETCGIIIGSTLGGVFGLILFGVLVYHIHKCIHKKRERHRQNETAKEIERVAMIVGPYIDTNPQILEMSDHIIPRHLRDVIPGLSERESHVAVCVIAKRRVELC